MATALPRSKRATPSIATFSAGARASPSSLLFLCFLLLSLLSSLAWALPQSSNSGSSGSSGSTNSSSSSSSNGNPTNSTVVPLGTRAVFGLQQTWMQKNSIYIGFLPDWSRESPIDINRELGKAMAIVGDYVDVYEDDISLSQIRWHSSDIVRLRDLSVYAPAIRPRFTLDKWTNEMSQAVADTCASLNRQGVKVWIRFAWEMNGSWMEYGQDPTNYVRAFRDLADTVKRTTNETWMLWSPNVRYGEVDSLVGYTQYYPGQDYVDLAGLSLYAPGEEGRVVESGAFSNALGSFNRLYGKQHPIIISETSAHYSYAIPSSMESIYCNDCDVRGSLPNVATLQRVPSDAADEAAIKIGWLDQLVGDNAAGRFPNLTAIVFFNYFKFGGGAAQNADTGSLVDYRVVGGHDETETRFRQVVGNVTAYQGGYSGHGVSALQLDARLAVGVVAAVTLSLLAGGL